jgi:hypothetical protein
MDEIIESGAFRLYAPSETHAWLSFYDNLIEKPLAFFAEDAFGVQFALIDGNVAIFQPETAELETVRMTQTEFYQAILDDPEGTISWSLYQAAVHLLGKPSSDQHFAFKVELAMGGQPAVENVVIADSAEHFKVMASIAKQIKNVPIGTAMHLGVE